MKLARFVLSVSAAALACATAPAFAQENPGSAADATAVDFDVPAQSLASALNAFAQTANVQFAYSAALVSDRTSQAVRGHYTVQEALARMLSGTGLTWRFSGARTIVLESAGASGVDGERVLGAVRVQGAQGGGSLLAGSTPVNGVNGSRDVTATEGTGSYTSNALTVGSKTAASIKDTPMSVSVITDQQLKDQNITDLNTAMRDAPGITVLHNSASDLSFWSRGFQITQMQIDGGAPQVIASGGGDNRPSNVGNYRPLIDLSLYDHVELVRGATGTFNGYGDPGGVINLVRKRPLDHAQMTIDMQLGSWDWHRFSADVTGPLAFDGKLRARVIATHQDNNYFYNVAKANRNVLSGTLELDVTPTTLLTAGITYQTEDDINWQGGLPRYQTGKAIDFPLGRATCLCTPWATNNARNLEYFGQIEQRLGDNWTLKVKANRIQQKSDQLTEFTYGAVDPILGTGQRINMSGVSHGRVKQTQIEATLDGTFRLFGQTQKIILGANYSMSDPAGSSDAGADFDPVTFQRYYFANGIGNDANVGDIRKFDPYVWQPDLSFGKNPFRGYDFGDYRVLNAYASFELTPLARFHVISALRYSQRRNRALAYSICQPWQLSYPNYYPQCVGKVGAKYYNISGQRVKGSNFGWPPSVQLRYDATDNLSAYAIYTDIYIDRSFDITEQGTSLPPTTGQNYEGGLKWLSPNKKFNASISAYYTKQINTSAVYTSSKDYPLPPGQMGQYISCCYVNDNDSYNLSYGVDLEFSGEVANGLQISTSYTYNINKSYNPGYTSFDGSRPPLQSLAPRHLAKLWATYAFDDRSKLNGLRIGLGAQARSSTFVQDSYCPVDPVSTPDGPQCPNPPGQKPVFFTDPGYVVLSASIGYKFSDKLSMDAQFENLLDKTYFEQVGGLSGGNWYGSPRSIKVSLRGKF